MERKKASKWLSLDNIFVYLLVIYLLSLSPITDILCEHYHSSNNAHENCDTCMSLLIINDILEAYPLLPFYVISVFSYVFFKLFSFFDYYLGSYTLIQQKVRFNN